MKRKKILGFTLIELAITILIVAILGKIALASYRNYVWQGRRLDATGTLSAISMAEERYRTSNSTYGTLAQVWNSVTTTSGGYYTLAITNITGTTYTITATATTAQSGDTESGVSCTPLVLSVSSGTVSKTPTACWSQ